MGCHDLHIPPKRIKFKKTGTGVKRGGKKPKTTMVQKEDEKKLRKQG